MSLIFISHSSSDASAAVEVRQRLSDFGHRSIFLDFDPADGIPAGRDWEQELYRRIRSCRAVVVLCSQASMGSRWCFMEITHARALGKHLFPIRLDDCDLEGILTDRQVIDLSQDREEAFRRLERGLRAAGLDPADAFDWDGSRPPYPGLLALQEADAAVFFGRDEEIGLGLDLLNRVRRLGELGLVMVLGASGTGKSSLVRAGILPRLRRDSEHWLAIEPFRPREHPARELAGVLSRAFEGLGHPHSWRSILDRLEGFLTGATEAAPAELDPESAGPAQSLADRDLLETLLAFEARAPEREGSRVSRYVRLLRTALESPEPKAGPRRPSGRQPGSESTNPLVDLATDLRLRSGRSEARVLLVVDQLEELLGHTEAHPSSRFLSLLRTAIESPDSPLLVLATMRSDFLGRFQNHPALLGLRHESLPLGPMSRDDIVQIIERPAEVAGIELGPGLVHALSEDAETGDALPLLAFTLRELNERCGKDGVLEVDEYRTELGGLGEAVARAAEDLLRGQGMEEAEEERLRAAFLRMARVTEEGTYARQPVRWEALPAESHPLLEKLVGARLLVSAGDAEDRTIEVAHEALFIHWDRLRNWLDQNGEALHLRREVHHAARIWDEEGRTEETLWRGGRLARARELIDGDELPLEPIGLAFVAASERAERAAREAEEERRRRKLRLAVGGALGAAALAGLAIVFAIQARVQAEVAMQQELAAEERARESSIAGERALSAQNFAEYQRVAARAEATEPNSDEGKALAAIAPKYLDQSKLHQARARELEEDLAAWRLERSRIPQAPDLLFSMEVVQARSGNCLILLYGPPAAPRVMLFDGGDISVYKRTLRPRLEALRRRWWPEGPLPFDLVVSSQTDIQHLKGLLDLIDELRAAHAEGRPPPFEIGALWSNAFLPEGVAAAMTRLPQKLELVAGASTLEIPLNEPFSRLVTRPEAGAARVYWDHGLSITVLGPPVENLRDFADHWLEQIERRLSQTSYGPAHPGEALAALQNYEILETFESPRIELLPSPIEIVEVPVPGGTDESVVNLASIVLMLELEGQRMLLTADARADFLFQALAQAGYVDEEGSTEVGLLVLPHMGSDRNVSVEFFRRVKARHYVVPGDGIHGNPEPRTFEMLFEARRGDPRPFTLYLSYPPEELGVHRGRPYPIEELIALFERERRSGTPFEVVTPVGEQVSVRIDLLSPR